MYCLSQGTMERRKKLHEARKPLRRLPALPTVSITITHELQPPVISSSFLCHGDIDNHVVESEWLNNRDCHRNPSSGEEGRRRTRVAWRPRGQLPSRRRRRYHPCALSPPYSPLCRGTDGSLFPSYSIFCGNWNSI